MMEKLELFKALTDKQFYANHQHALTKELFAEELWDLYEALEKTHTIHKEDVERISLREIWAVYVQDNPVATPAKLAAVKDILTKVHETEDLSPSILEEVFKTAMAELKATKIAQAALEIANGSSQDWEKLKQILNEDMVKEEIPLVSTDLTELQSTIASTYKWRFNLPALDAAVGPIGPEMLCVLAGPVNSGKTAMGLSFVYGPGGFLEQGAKVLHVGNEENMTRTVLRGISSHTGFTEDDLKDEAKQGIAKALFDKVRGNLFPINAVGMDFGRLGRIINKFTPDIVLLDMLDKVRVRGTFNRGDEALGHIYEKAREVAKEYKVAVLGMSQTSAESFGKLHYGFDKLAGSRVEKAANADLILLLGKQMTEFEGQGDSPYRMINISKAKSEANGKIIPCTLQNTLSRLV